MTTYNKAPLPFQGQKRNWIKEVRLINFNENIVIDLFGGSGLLSHTIKTANPKARVIWNDYDDYRARLELIDETNELRDNLASYRQTVTKKANDVTKAEIIKIVEKHLKKYDRVDWITLGSWILFSGKYSRNYEEFIKQTFYPRVRKKPINADNYLMNVERVQSDFRGLIDEYKDNDDVIYVCDPPYIMTDQTGYSSKNDKHFRLKETLELLSSLKDKKAILFSSTKSETDYLIELYFKQEKIERIEHKATGASGSRYTEILYLLNM